MGLLLKLFYFIIDTTILIISLLFHPNNTLTCNSPWLPNLQFEYLLLFYVMCDYIFTRYLQCWQKARHKYDKYLFILIIAHTHPKNKKAKQKFTKVASLVTPVCKSLVNQASINLRARERTQRKPNTMFYFS